MWFLLAGFISLVAWHVFIYKARSPFLHDAQRVRWVAWAYVAGFSTAVNMIIVIWMHT